MSSLQATWTKAYRICPATPRTKSPANGEPRRPDRVGDEGDATQSEVGGIAVITNLIIALLGSSPGSCVAPAMIGEKGRQRLWRPVSTVLRGAYSARSREGKVSRWAGCSLSLWPSRGRDFEPWWERWRSPWTSDKDAEKYWHDLLTGRSTQGLPVAGLVGLAMARQSSFSCFCSVPFLGSCLRVRAHSATTALVLNTRHLSGRLRFRAGRREKPLPASGAAARFARPS